MIGEPKPQEHKHNDKDFDKNVTVKLLKSSQFFIYPRIAE